MEHLLDVSLSQLPKFGDGVPPKFIGVNYSVIGEYHDGGMTWGPIHPGIDKPTTERPCRQCEETALADGSVVPKK